MWKPRTLFHEEPATAKYEIIHIRNSCQHLYNQDIDSTAKGWEKDIFLSYWHSLTTGIYTPNWTIKDNMICLTVWFLTQPIDNGFAH